MVPLRDDIPARRFPWVTVMIIAVNGLVFGGELSLGRELERFLFEYGIVPARYTRWEVAQFFGLYEQAIPFFTSMFLHGGWLHLLGNMWTLWVFGDNVEDKMGRGKYLLFYLVSGCVSAWLHILTNTGSVVPTIGASGAVAGVMGAYVFSFPRARITTLIPPFFLGPFFVLPAVFFLGWWFLLQFFNGTLSLFADQSRIAGIAWWAHVGGFAFGVAVAAMIKNRGIRRHPDYIDV